MRKAAYIFGILILGMIFSSCGGSKISKMETSIVTLQDENRAMTTKVENLELKLSDTEGRLTSTEQELAALKIEKARLKFEAEQTAITEAKRKSAEESVKSASSPKIKVVARGTKGVKKANASLSKIKKLGYKVGVVDKTGGKDIKKRTIFYREGFRPVAHKISKALGGGLLLKQINWKSVYDIIVAP